MTMMSDDSPILVNLIFVDASDKKNESVNESALT